MNDVSDGELNFTDRKELEAWLKTQPREVSVVIAARAALRVLPLLYRLVELHPDRFTQLASKVSWANASAWVVAKYPTRANELRTVASAAASAAGSAVLGTHVSNAFAADVAAASAAADVASDAASAAASAVFAACSAADSSLFVGYPASVALWTAFSTDARQLSRVRPDVLAGQGLWHGGGPVWSQIAWRDAPSEPTWKPWLDWYQRRLEGAGRHRTSIRDAARRPARKGRRRTERRTRGGNRAAAKIASGKRGDASS